jgi:metallo-beta-lactamase class B
MQLRLSAAAVLLPAALAAQPADPLTAPYSAEACPSCAGWNVPQPPLRLFGNTYYVGTRGLGAVLVTSPEGHVLIDGGLPDSAPLILENVRALGFDPADVRLILNSHAHFDHAGGIAALQRASGARVAASAASAPVLASGRTGHDDPQFGIAFDFPAVAVSDTVADGETVRVGPLALTLHLTPGHTTGGSTWSWRSCEGERCLSFVYADSRTPVSADGFRYSDGPYATAVADFERGAALLERLPCDVLVTPHPGASSLWERIVAGPEGLVDATACRRYAAAGREQLRRRLEREAGER